MTWNIQVMPEGFCLPVLGGAVPGFCITIDPAGVEDHYGLPDWERASVKILERIKRIDADIVVLNEYWIPDGGPSLDVQLRAMGKYPYAIRQLNNDGRTSASGLMLLSRYPFRTLPVCQNGLTTHVEGVAGDTWFEKDACYVNTHLYAPPGVGEEVIDPDSLAAKMAAVASVQTDWGCVVNIAFTHMTASYGGEAMLTPVSYGPRRQKARERAHVAMANLIESTFPNSELQHAPLIYLGDLNVDGNFGSDHSPDVSDGKPPPYYDTPTVSQWERLFSQGSLTNLFACGSAAFAAGNCVLGVGGEDRLLTDAWGFEQPRSDNGVTYGGGEKGTLDEPNGERLDYVFHNHPTDDTGQQYLCMQHVQRLYSDHQDLGCDWCGIPFINHYDDGVAYSDHLGVFADFGFNLQATPQCNPVEKDISSPQIGPWYGSEPVLWGDPPGGVVTDPQNGVPWPAGDSDRIFPVELLFKRHYAWFKIPEDNDGNGAGNEPKDRGTFSIGAHDWIFGDLDIRVYQGADLSWQVPSAHQYEWEDLDWKAKVYFLPNPPYYVRVSVRDAVAEQSGYFPIAPFQMIFRKNTCTDPYSDVCILTPGKDNAVEVGWTDDYNYAWNFTPDADPHDLSGAACPAGLANSQSPFYKDEMYFRFAVDAPEGANSTADFLITATDYSQFDFQDLTAGKGIKIFDAGNDNPPGNGAFNVKHCDSSDPDEEGCSAARNQVVPVPVSILPSGAALVTSDNHTTGIFAPVNPGVPRPFILRIHRTDGTPQMVDMTVEMVSSLTLVKMKMLKSHITNDWPSSTDDLGLFVRLDGDAQPSCEPFPSGANWFQELHEKRELTNGGFKGHVFPLVLENSQISIRLCEEDSYTDSDHYWTSWSRPGFAWTGDFQEGVLGENGGDPGVEVGSGFAFCNGGTDNCDDADWQYELKYSRRKDEIEKADAGGGLVPPSCP